MFGELGFLLSAIGAIAFFAGFLHSAIGVGFGIVAISLLPFVIDARSAHVVVSISSVPMLIMAAWTYREGIEKRSLALALLGAAIFLPLGLRLFESVSLDLLVRGTGLGILVMVILSLRRVSSAQPAGSVGRSSFLAGAVSGFLAGAVSIAGPPIAAFALKQGWSQARYKAFVTQCLLVMSIYKAALLVLRSHVEGPVATQIVVAAALAIVGVQAGAIASRGISAEQFKRVVAAALVAVACLMMWQGQSETRQSESNRNDSQVESSQVDHESRESARRLRFKPNLGSCAFVLIRGSSWICHAPDRTFCFAVTWQKCFESTRTTYLRCRLDRRRTCAGKVDRSSWR